jgi:hypothetical protein
MDLVEIRGGGGCGLDVSNFRYDPVEGSCGNCNEYFSTINDFEFLD